MICIIQKLPLTRKIKANNYSDEYIFIIENIENE